MGFQVKEYDISELHRISIPGRVTPCLFWTIPIGAWKSDELTELWEHFTRRPGKCHDLGLVLLKETPLGTETRNVRSYVDLAKVSDFLPAGAARHHRDVESRMRDVRKVLIMSGGYPQPGWGLLLEFDRLESFIRVIEKCFYHPEMRTSLVVEKLRCIEATIRNYNNVFERQQFHRQINEAVEIQWELGPKFLVALEKSCNTGLIKVTNIPWDSARMIGWKIHASGITIHSNDLAVAAQELAPNAASDVPENDNLADGSYFTDYVHYVAISRPGFSPRLVTSELLKSLLRPTEIINLINEFSATTHAREMDKTTLVEVLLNKLGWLGGEENKEKPLASCIKAVAEGGYVLNDHIEGNQIRITLESFCKDVIDVIISQLGYEHDEIWRVIEENRPDYQCKGRIKNWDHEVKSMTVGAAIIILKIFGPLAFTSQNELMSINNLISYLYRLSEILNRASHHNDEEPAQVMNNPEIPNLIYKIIETTKAAIGDLPWHMKTSFVYGEQPKVLSGEAWSHGHSLPRLLRAILWAGESVNSQVVLWNKSRINPVIPNPCFLNRPKPN